MAFTMRDALLKAGLAKAVERPKKTRTRYEPAPDKPNPPPFEPPLSGKITNVIPEPFELRRQLCVQCDREFAPEAQEHKLYGRYDECGQCAKEYDITQRLEGEMIWDHKTAPTLEIKGRPSKLTPDEIAALRRR